MACVFYPLNVWQRTTGGTELHACVRSRRRQRHNNTVVVVVVVPVAAEINQRCIGSCVRVNCEAGNALVPTPPPNSSPRAMLRHSLARVRTTPFVIVLSVFTMHRVKITDSRRIRLRFPTIGERFGTALVLNVTRFVFLLVTNVSSFLQR